MKPENVKPAKFKKHTIIYQDEGFSIAYGIWNNEKKPRLAMRWDGDKEDDLGYPSQGGNPLWFQLPNTGIWTSEIIKAAQSIEGNKKLINDLNKKIK